tara:strand:- start:46 stop:519 length:474 start_codon:yes stop_codon:yes gene_type:complete
MEDCVINDTKVKLVDGEIYSYIKKGRSKNYRWCLLKGYINNGGYRVVRINKKDYLYHRIIYKLHNTEWNIDDSSTNNSIDHIDMDKLNNNIENLRVVTHQQNMFNRGDKGYYWNKNAKKYHVRITVNGKTIDGGLFKNEEYAISKREDMKVKYHTIH